MKTAKLTLMFLACAAAIPAFAQNTTDSRCGATNYDRSRNIFTIANPNPATANQQCFITVVPKASWTGGAPDPASSQFVEGNYEVALSGGGGGGGGGGTGRNTEHGRRGAGTGGEGGGSAIPATTVRYLTPGVYRLTIGSGGRGGASSGGHGADGAPTSLSNAYSGETMAGFSGSESWDGSYNSGKGLMAYYSGKPPMSAARGADGGSGGARDTGDPGLQGGHGFITLALKDSVPQAAPAASSETVITPAPAATRPAKKDRN